MLGLVGGSGGGSGGGNGGSSGGGWQWTMDSSQFIVNVQSWVEGSIVHAQ